MREVRGIKELLVLMLDHQEFFATGLCWWAYKLFKVGLITEQEHDCIQRLISKDEIRYINRSNSGLYYGSLFYWPMGDIEPRIEWINEKLKSL